MVGDRNEVRVNQQGEHIIASSQIDLKSSFVVVDIDQLGEGSELNAQANITGRSGHIFIIQDGVDLRDSSFASIVGQGNGVSNEQVGEHGESLSIASSPASAMPRTSTKMWQQVR